MLHHGYDISFFKIEPSTDEDINDYQNSKRLSLLDKAEKMRLQSEDLLKKSKDMLKESELMLEESEN